MQRNDKIYIQKKRYIPIGRGVLICVTLLHQSKSKCVLSEFEDNQLNVIPTSWKPLTDKAQILNTDSLQSNRTSMLFSTRDALCNEGRKQSSSVQTKAYISTADRFSNTVMMALLSKCDEWRMREVFEAPL